MDLRTYQARALAHDQHPGARDLKGPEVVIPLLGLAGEVGELLSEYKKYLRDGDAHKLFTERVGEELGDLLWYLTTVASKFGLELQDIAKQNLAKCADRWPVGGRRGIRRAFDAGFPADQRLPRQMDFELTTLQADGKTKMVAYLGGEQVGNELTDNAYSDDGYRYHDVFHLACAGVLGWSPVLRKLLGRKRRSRKKTDEVEDGGRAIAIEEGLAALAFTYADQNNFLDGAKGVSHDLLRTIKAMTGHLEVSERSAGEWEKMLLMCFEVWRALKKGKGGRVKVDLDRRKIVYVGRLRKRVQLRSRSRRRGSRSG